MPLDLGLATRQLLSTLNGVMAGGQPSFSLPARSGGTIVLGRRPPVSGAGVIKMSVAGREKTAPPDCNDDN